MVAACLWAGGHASHRTAAHLLSLPGGRRYPIEVSTNRPLTSERLIVHRRAPLPDCDLTVVNGLPTTAPHRTLLDLAAGVPEVVVEMALDEALKKELVTYPQAAVASRIDGPQGYSRHRQVAADPEREDRGKGAARLAA